MKHLNSILAFAIAVAAVPYKSSTIADSEAASLPLLNLSYGVWQATHFDAANEIYVFKNIRFAAPPVGPLRWARPAPPKPVSEIQNGSYGPQCIQASLTKNRFSDQFPSSESLDGGALPGLTGAGPLQSEDCLFLDVYVPKRVLEGTEKVPVIFWAHGGFWTSGSKDEPWVGTPFLKRPNSDLIFVTANYRLGAFGFLGGSSMERHGAPNAGIWDQRAALQWVQENISKLNGDPSKVSWWGHDSGAASALFHLTMYAGEQDPLFRKLVCLSPVLQQLYTRPRFTEETFKSFAAATGCTSQDVECLRNADTRILQQQNKLFVEQSPVGVMPFGPVMDGNATERSILMELIEGRYWKRMDTVIVGHASHEARLFTNPAFPTNTTFLSYLEKLIPGQLDACLRAQIVSRYHPKSPSHPQRPRSTEVEKAAAFLEDGVFGLAVNRLLAEVYSNRGIVHHPLEGFNTDFYAMNTEFNGGTHASPLLLMFYQPNTTFGAMGETVNPNIALLAEQWQAYLISHAIWGSPNVQKDPLVTPWPPASNQIPSDMNFANVLHVGDRGMEIKTDEQTGMQVALDAMFVSMALLPFLPDKLAEALCVKQEYGYYSADSEKWYSLIEELGLHGLVRMMRALTF